MQRLMSFSLCLWKILSHINIPILLRSVGLCTLYLVLEDWTSAVEGFPLQDRKTSPAPSEHKLRSRKAQADIRQEEPSKSVPTFAVHLWLVVSQLASSRREVPGCVGHSATEDDGSWASCDQTHTEESFTSGGWAGSRRGWGQKFGKERLGRVAETKPTAERVGEQTSHGDNSLWVRGSCSELAATQTNTAGWT